MSDATRRSFGQKAKAVVLSPILFVLALVVWTLLIAVAIVAYPFVAIFCFIRFTDLKLGARARLSLIWPCILVGLSGMWPEEQQNKHLLGFCDRLSRRVVPELFADED